MKIWDDGNLKAIGVKTTKKTYKINVDVPISVFIDEDHFYNFRSVLLRNNIPFKEEIQESKILKN